MADGRGLGHPRCPGRVDVEGAIFDSRRAAVGTAKDFPRVLPDVTIDARDPELRAAIVDANAGPVDIVLEMVGGRTFTESYDALAPFGRLVSYGMASRQIPEPIDVLRLNRETRGVLGFWLASCFRSPDAFGEPARELLDMVASGELRAIVGGTYPLGEARRAHEDLRERRTVGKLVLDPRS